MTTLARSSAYSIVSSGLQVVASVISGVLVARMLGVDGKGEVFLVRQFAGLGSVLLALGLPASLVYAMRQGRLPVAGALASGLVVCLVVGLGLALLSRFGRPALIAITGGELDPRALDLLLWLTFAQVAVLFLSHVVIGTSAGVVISSVQRMVSTLVYVGPLLVCYLVRPLVAHGVMALLLAAAAVNLALALAAILRRLDGPCLPPPPAAVAGLLRYGGAMYLGNLMLSSLLRLDTFFVNGALGADALGRYSAAVSVGELLLVVPTAIGVAHFPHLAGQGEPDREESAALVFRLTVLFGLAGGVMLAMLGYPALLVFGRDFLPALPAFYWLLPGIVAMAAVFPLANFFNSSGRPGVSLICFGVMVAGNIGLNLVLLHPLGIVGAALASTITYGLALGLFIVFFRRQTGRPLRSLAPHRDDLAVVRRLIGRRFTRSGSCAE